MPGRDKSSGGGRSEEERRRDLAARELARVEGKRPPPSFGPSTRAGRERAAASGSEAPTPRVAGAAAGTGRAQDASFDFDFARPSTRAAGSTDEVAHGVIEPEVADPRIDRRSDAATATVEAPPSAAPETASAPAGPVPPAPAPGPRGQPGATPPGHSGGDAPEFAPLQSTRTRRADRADRAPRRVPFAARLEPLRRSRVVVAALVAGVLLLLVIGVMAIAGGDDTADPQQVAEEKKQAPSPYGTPTPTPLPPDTRVVAYTGAPQAEELGILGTMPFERAADRLERQAAPYDRASRPVVPAFDLIATIANADPGPGGKYRTRQSPKVIARYLRAARRHDAALILDVQPGTSNFVDEIKPLERWLKEPDVHLALDPEWRMRPGVRPGSEIGWVSAGEVTATLNRVARIVRANDLPPKLVLVHRFTDGMIKDLETVDVPKEVVGVISIDGVGTRTQKIHTYDRIASTLPKPWLPGFKIFYVEDKAAGGILSGKQTMALTPRPHVVLYE